MTTSRYQDEVAETLANRWGGVHVVPMNDGTGSVVMQGRIDDVLLGDPLLVPEEMGAREATLGEVRRVFVDGQAVVDVDLVYELDGLLYRDGTGEPVTCSWFALCENQATKVRQHPILNGVPICERCDAKVEAQR